MSKLGFIKRHYKAFLLFLGTCIVCLSLGFNVIMPFFDKRFNQFQIKEKEKGLEPLGVLYGLMPAAVTDSYEWDIEEGQNYHSKNNIIRLNNSEYYLIAFKGESGTENDGYVCTIRVWNNNGTIRKTRVDSWEFDTSDSQYFSLDKIPNTDIYVLMYYDSGANKETFITFKVSDVGVITKSKIDTQVLSQGGNRGVGLRLTNNIFARVYSENVGADGWMETVWISSTGTINNSVCDTQEFDIAYCYAPHICIVDSDTVAIVYSDSSDDGRLVTYNVSGSGVITNTNSSWWEFDATIGFDAFIKKISGNVFTIAYQGAATDGFVKTLTISNAGTVTKSFIDSLEFHITDMDYPLIFTINDGSVYGISYQDVASGDGWIDTVNISRSGDIGAAIIDTMEFDVADTIYWSPVVWVNQSKYLVVWEGTNNDGWSATFNITTNWASPTFSSPSPANNSVDQALTPQCAITINDKNGDTVNVYFAENSTGPWIIRQANTSVACNGTYKWTFDEASSYSLKYYWKVFVNDGTHNVSNWFCFTTEAPPAQEKTWQPLFTSTLTFGNITTGNASLFTSTLTFGNITTGNSQLFTSSLSFGNATTAYSSLFTSSLSFGNETANTTMFTSSLTFGNITVAKSLFASSLTFGNITTKYASLFTSTLTFGNISSGNITSLFTSNLSFGNITSNHSFFTSLLSFGNMTSPHSLFTSSLTFGNTTILAPATPYNINLLVINPNPGNGTHNTNYLKSNASGLTTSIDIYYDNFTTPPTSPPSTDIITILGTPMTEVCLYNSSTNYTNVWANTTGNPVATDTFVGQYKVGTTYVTYRSMLFFDTSVIPDDAIIDNGKLVLVGIYDGTTPGGSDFNVTIQETKNPVPHNPLIPTDYWKNAYASNFGYLNTTSFVEDDYFNITLNAAGLSYIKLTGETKFALRSDQDINHSAPPNSEIVAFYAYSLPAYYPRIVISYHTPNPNWKHLVNLTWLSNSSGPWKQYAKSYVNVNGTTTVYNHNFTGIDTYYWHLEWESNNTNNGSSQVFTFTTVKTGISISMGGRDRFNIGFILGSFFFLILGMIIWKKKQKRRT